MFVSIRSLVIFGLSILAMFTGSLIYAHYAAEHAAQLQCPVIVTFDDSYHQQPPITAAGKLAAVRIHELRIHLGCPKESS